jgi:hypothetical protein
MQIFKAQKEDIVEPLFSADDIFENNFTHSLTHSKKAIEILEELCNFTMSVYVHG